MSPQAENKIMDLLIEMNQKLDQHTTILEQHSKTLDQHTAILEQHSKTLDQHTAILERHSRILEQHTGRLDHHEEMLKENTGILRALEHAFQVQKADLDQIIFKVSAVEGDMKAVKQDINAVEIITAKNWSDMAHFKAVQNL